MKISEKYLETLKSINDWTTVSDWTIQFGKQYPVIRVQKIIEQKMAVELDESLIENIIARLKLVY